MPRSKTPRRDPIVHLLKEAGPMTTIEIAEALDWERLHVTLAIQKARRSYPGEFFRIVRWQQQTGRWSMDHPVYAAQRGADAIKPKLDRKARNARNQKRYREKYGEAYRAAARIRERARRGVAIVNNPFLTLLPPNVRQRMGHAANTAMKEAA
jgi:hypothetical protein